MDRQLGKFTVLHPQHFAAFVTCMKCSGNLPSAKANGKFLSDFPVAVSDNVIGVGVEADEAGNLAFNAGFLAYFPDGGLGKRLA